MSKKYLFVLFPVLLSCNTQQKDFEILKLKAMIDSAELKAIDSLNIYNQIKNDSIYIEVTPFNEAN